MQDHEMMLDVPRSDRRRFLGRAGLAAVGALLRAGVPFARHFPAGLIPAALALHVERANPGWMLRSGP